jgi:hypothetical protein
LFVRIQPSDPKTKPEPTPLDGTENGSNWLPPMSLVMVTTAGLTLAATATITAFGSRPAATADALAVAEGEGAEAEGPDADAEGPDADAEGAGREAVGAAVGGAVGAAVGEAVGAAAAGATATVAGVFVADGVAAVDCVAGETTCRRPMVTTEPPIAEINDAARTAAISGRFEGRGSSTRSGGRGGGTGVSQDG